MPKYKYEVLEKKHFMWLVTIIILIVTVLFVYKPVFIGVCLGLFGIYLAYGYFIQKPKMQRYFDKLLEERNGLSICDFAREFDVRVVDSWIIRAVYEQLQGYVMVPNFPIKAEDNILTTLQIDEEDFFLDIVEEIAERTGRSLECCLDNPYRNEVDTVKNLVYFFNHQPMQCRVS